MSTWWNQLLRRPQTLRLRGWIFQIHLWTGLILALYFLVVGLSGSILVFREELTALGRLDLARSPHPDAPLAGIDTVTTRLRAAYPRHQVASVQLPSLYTQNFRSFLNGQPSLIVYSDRGTGRVLGSIDRDSSWITFTQQLHFYLLAGKPGLIVNAIGGLILALLCATGLFLWWPGVRRWTRVLVLNLRAGWKRINWDLHTVLGFWTLPIVLLWGLTGAYFAWPLEFAMFVNRFSPVTVASPNFKVQPLPGATQPDLAALVALARAREPQHELAGVIFPTSPTAPIRILMARGELWNTRATNYLFYDPYRLKYLGTWQRGVDRTAGDTVVNLVGPLHFGVYWGMTVKILYAVLGLMLPVLAITGCIMYWNRSLSKLWKRLRV